MYQGPPISDAEILELVPDELRQLLLQANGFILFGGGLHIRGACLAPDWHSLREVWTGEHALHHLFPVINEDDVPFAQDCLGDQFILRSGVVQRLNAEVGELEQMGVDLREFLRLAEEDPLEYLSLHPLRQFESEGGRLKPGQLLSVIPPFIVREAAEGVSLKAISMFDRIGFLAELASQISHLEDGARINLRVDAHPQGKAN